MSKIKWKKEIVLKQLKGNIEKLGYIPIRSEYQRLKFKPSYSWFTDNFNGFVNAIEQIHFDKEITKNKRQLTKEDLIKNLQQLNDKLGKSPTSKEVKNPTAIAYYKKFNTQSWNKILEIAGLTTNWQSFSKEYAKQKMIKLYNKLKRVPKKLEIKEEKDMPSLDWYFEHFGGIEKVCLEYGLIEEILTNEQRIQIAIDELIKLANEFKRVPTVKEYEEIKHKGFTRRDLEKHLNMKYNNICRKYIPQYKLIFNRDITNEEIINSIHKMYAEYGYILPQEEYLQLDYTYDVHIIKRRFDITYGQFVESLGYKVYGNINISKTDDEMLSDFLLLFKKLKRIPYSYEIDNNKDICSYGTYIDRFKSLQNMCVLLNIDWNKYYKQKRGGAVLLDKNNGLCLSYPERDITNFFIDNDIKYVKEPKYSDILNNKDNRKFDWKIIINNKTYYLEYFGMYNNSRKDKKYMTYIYTKNARKKIKDLYENNLINNCIFIFPYDYKQNKIKSIFENICNTTLLDVKYTKQEDKLNQSIYENYTQEQLLDEAIKYSDDILFLPSTSYLTKENCSLYNEIIRRYKSINNFATMTNKKPRRISQEYWTINNILQLFKYINNKYQYFNSYLLGEIKNDINLKGLGSLFTKYGTMNLRLMYIEFLLNNGIHCNNEDIEYLKEINNNKRKNITYEQKEYAQMHLNRVVI